MIIGSGIRFGGNPMRTMGGNSAGNIERTKWNAPGGSRNWYAGQGTMENGVSIAEKSAFPEGYVHPYCWIMAQSSGGMASRDRLLGSEIISLGMAGGLGAEAGLTGYGFINDANSTLIISLVAGLTGYGFIGNALGVCIAQASAGLTGYGSVNFLVMTGKGFAIAGLTGNGYISATSTATGELNSEITVSGELLNTANVADAVWSKLIEEGFDAQRVLKIIAAAVAGKTTGGPGSPVFRNLTDTENQISGVSDSNGNRSSINYGD